MPNYPKQAMVGYYAGSLGELHFPSSAGFKIVDANTGAQVYQGSLAQRTDVGYAYTPTPYQQVYQADFSGFNTFLDRPDIRGRTSILQVHARGKPLEENVSLEVLAKQTPGFSGADLANLLNEAAILAARRNKHKIGMSELAADLKLGLHLLDEAQVLGIRADDVLEGVELLGDGVADCVDDATGAFAEALDHIIVKQFLAHC